MYLFFRPEIQPGYVMLDPDESKHCIKVMRFRQGDLIHLTDGKGNLFEAELDDPDFRACRLNVKKIIPEFGKRNFSLHIGITPTKNPARFEWFLEKATELGIERITPLLTQKSEKKTLNRMRAQNILISSIKQSNRAYLPVLSDPSDFKKVVESAVEPRKYLATCSGKDRQELLKACKPQYDTLILIGPEGDFTEDEISFALENGFETVSLGNARLRTETAALAACMTINIVNHSL